MVKNSLKLSIIIVGFNTKNYTLPCLFSIFKNSPSFPFEVIYVDNGSKDNSPLFVKNKFPKVKVIQLNQNFGYSKANNIGFKNSRGKFLFFLNTDTEILNQCLSKMVNFMEVHKKVGILGPRLYNSKNYDIQQSFSGRITPLTAIFAFSFLSNLFPKNKFYKSYYLPDLNKDKVLEVEAVSGAALMVRRELFEKIGGFDENFFAFFEENDLCLRVKKMGFKVIYYPYAQLIHYGGKTTKMMGQLPSLFFKQSRYKFFKKHFGVFKALFVESFLRFFEFFPGGKKN